MPKFARYGPNVPDRLVQALEDDRVVIFCGAGISMGAGLPDFRGLVKHCYDELLITPPAETDRAWDWLDRMLGSLESETSSDDMRRVVVERLRRPAKSLDLHQAILKLSTLNQVTGVRLVTTNFDHYFEDAQAGLVFGQDIHSAPVLPIPRNDKVSSWRSIAYLHGRLNPTSANDHLVLTSADFGRAYLTDGWAARFVTRLFADFTILFIGYSLNDPVLRYMTDAFAAEAKQNKSASGRGPAYIFVSHTGSKPPPEAPFRVRNLEPIFYNQYRDHLRLTETLVAWADARQDYFLSTQNIIQQSAARPPQSLDPGEVSNVVWACLGRISDNGHGARVFAQLDTLPPFEWLTEFARFEEDQRRQWDKDLADARHAGDALPQAPVEHVSQLIESGAANPFNQSPTAAALSAWLLRHLETPAFLDWVIDQLQYGRRLHPQFRHAIRKKLADTTTNLNDAHRTFWHIATAEGAWNRNASNPVTWHWLAEALAANSTTGWCREELFSVLRPYLQLRKSYVRDFEDAQETPFAPRQSPQTFREIAETEVHLAGADNLPRILPALLQEGPGPRLLADNIDRLTGHLLQTLNLFDLVHPGDADRDRSALERPSIENHDQNRGSAAKEWPILFDLLMSAWANLDARSPGSARQVLAHWRSLPYLSFRRLVLACLRISANFSDSERLEALLDA